MSASKSATILWSVDRDACDVTPAADTTVASLTCENYVGDVTVTAVGTSGNETVTRTALVTVEPLAPSQPAATALTFNASAGHPTLLTASLVNSENGSPLAARRVAFERKATDGTHKTIGTVTTDPSGVATYVVSITAVSTFRARFLGDEANDPSMSSTQRSSCPQR